MTIVKILLDHGADIEAVDFQGYTPLHIAAKAGSEANTQLLLERGAESNAKGKAKPKPKSKAAIGGAKKRVITTAAVPPSSGEPGTAGGLSRRRWFPALSGVVPTLSGEPGTA